MKRFHHFLRSVLILFLLSSAALADGKSEFEQKHSVEVLQIKQKLKQLHSAALAYLKAHQGVWPQCPETAEETLEKNEAWWKQTLEPFGAKKEDWLISTNGDVVAFSATSFEPERLAAFRYSMQPWFMTAQTIGPENAVYIIFPEGDILVSPFDDALFPKPGGSIKVRPAKIPEDLKPNENSAGRNR
jgi:hypothetical protein